MTDTGDGGVAPILGQWYVAALSSDVTAAPVRRVVCGEAIALYRTADGAVVALADACPHRAYPLSSGRVENGALVCGYHGFTFDRTGTCVAVPGQATVPRAANARAYAVVEQPPLVWTFAGDAEQADPSRVPSVPWASDAGWAAFASQALLAARYGLVLDNLLDLSHETYVHAGTIGSPEVAATPIVASLDGDVVRVSRHMTRAACPPFYAETTGMRTPIDRRQDIEFRAPGFYVLHVRVAPHGAGDEAAASLKIVYCVTPAHARETHLFFLVCRDFAIDRADVTETLDRIQAQIIEQDRAVLERLERTLPAAGWSEVSIGIDRGALLARQALRALAGAGRARKAG